MIDHDARSYDLIARVFDGQSEGLTRDDILDNITLYWLKPNTTVSSARLVLGKQASVLCAETYHHPGCCERVSGRALSSTKKSYGRSKRIRSSSITTSSTKAGSLRGVGTAADLL